jgi:hypothetical protein
LSNQIATRNDNTGSVQVLDISKREFKRKKKQRATIKPVQKLEVSNLDIYDHNYDPEDPTSILGNMQDTKKR